MVDAILEARTLPVAMHNPSLFTTPVLLMQNYPNGLRQGCQTIIQRGPHNITTRTYKLENMQSTQINVSPLIYIEPTITKTKMNQQYRWGSISVDIKSGSTQAPWIHSKPVLIQPVPYRGKQRVLRSPQRPHASYSSLNGFQNGCFIYLKAISSFWRETGKAFTVHGFLPILRSGEEIHSFFCVF